MNPLLWRGIPVVLLSLIGSIVISTSCWWKRPLEVLTVANVRMEGPKLSFELTNKAKARITACTIAIENQGIERSRQISRWTADWYTNSSQSHLAPLQPKESRVETIIAAHSSPTSLPRLSVVAVVFDDATAVGEPAHVDAIFQRRNEERRQLAKLVDAYVAGLDLTATVPIEKLPLIVADLPVEKRRAALAGLQAHVRELKPSEMPALIIDLQRMVAVATTEMDSDVHALTRVSRLYAAALRHTRRGD